LKVLSKAPGIFSFQFRDYTVALFSQNATYSLLESRGNRFLCTQ